MLQTRPHAQVRRGVHPEQKRRRRADILPQYVPSAARNGVKRRQRSLALNSFQDELSAFGDEVAQKFIVRFTRTKRGLAMPVGVPQPAGRGAASSV